MPVDYRVDIKSCRIWTRRLQVESISRGKLLKGVGLLSSASREPLCEAVASTDLNPKATIYGSRKARGVGDHWNSRGWNYFPYWLHEKILPILQMELLGPKCTPGPGSQSRNSHFNLIQPSPSFPSGQLLCFMQNGSSTPPPGRSLTAHLDFSSLGPRTLGFACCIHHLPLSSRTYLAPTSSLFEGLTFLHPHAYPQPLNKRVLHK